MMIGYPENTVMPYEDPNWLFRKANVTLTSNPKIFQVNSLFGIHEAVKNGMGLAALPDYLIKDTKEIETCLDDVTPDPVNIYFVYSQERENSTRLKVLKKFLEDSAKKTAF